jgi:hypothetical protein
MAEARTWILGEKKWQKCSFPEIRECYQGTSKYLLYIYKKVYKKNRKIGLNITTCILTLLHEKNKNLKTIFHWNLKLIYFLFKDIVLSRIYWRLKTRYYTINKSFIEINIYVTSDHLWCHIFLWHTPAYYFCIKDKPATIREIAEFLGRKLTDEDVERITEHCRVENMRDNPMVNLAYFRDIKTLNDDADGRFINAGKYEISFTT